MPNAFAHIELTTDNLENDKKFYAKIFDWKLTDMPGMPYTMIDVGTGTGGGMQPRPMPEAPSGWMPYVQVESVAKTMAKVAKAGGKALVPYQSIGDMGAIGVLADPSGAVIGIWESKPKAPEPPAKKTAKVSAKKAPPPKSAPKKEASSSKKTAKKTVKKAAAKPPAPAPKKAAKAPAKKSAPAAKKAKK